MALRANLSDGLPLSTRKLFSKLFHNFLSLSTGMILQRFVRKEPGRPALPFLSGAGPSKVVWGTIRKIASLSSIFPRCRQRQHGSFTPVLIRKAEKFPGIGCGHLDSLLPEPGFRQVHSQVPGSQVFHPHAAGIPQQVDVAFLKAVRGFPGQGIDPGAEEVPEGVGGKEYLLATLPRGAPTSNQDISLRPCSFFFRFRNSTNTSFFPSTASHITFRVSADIRLKSRGSLWMFFQPRCL